MNNNLVINEELYLHKINTGKIAAKNLSLGVVALARNIENVFDRNYQVLERDLLKYFKSHEFFIYENDSEDGTVESLEKWSKTDNHNYISEKLNAPKFGSSTTQERLKVMSHGRNVCQKNISKNHDYILVIDLDFIHLDTEGLFNSLGWLQEDSIGAMSGFSFHYRIQPLPERLKTKNPIWTNYDSWAYRHTDWHDLYSQGLMYWFWWWLPPKGSIPWPVNSAFGGSCLFKSKYYFDGEYKDHDCEHVTHFYEIKKNNPEFMLFNNPSQRMIV